MKKIEPKLVEAILNYLATQQWREVNEFIVALTSLENVEKDVKKEDAVKTTD